MTVQLKKINIGHQRVKHWLNSIYILWQCIHTLCIRISIDLRVAMCYLLLRVSSIFARDHLEFIIFAMMHLIMVNTSTLPRTASSYSNKTTRTISPPFTSFPCIRTYMHSFFHCCVNKIYNLINNLHA